MDQIQIICNVSEERAKELLDASSGSIERAIDLHFSLQHHESSDVDGLSGMQQRASNENNGGGENAKNQATTIDDTKSGWRDSNLDDPTTPKETDVMRVPTENQSRRSLFAAYANKTWPSSRKRHQQGTLDSFLGKQPRHSRRGGKTSLSSRKFSFTADDDNSTAQSVLEKKTSEVAESVVLTPEEHEIQSLDTCATSEQRFQMQDCTGGKAEQKGCLTPTKKIGVVQTPREIVDATTNNIPFLVLAETLSQVADTTKRTIKLEALKGLFCLVITKLGGVHEKCDRRESAHVLTCLLDLILGKLSPRSLLTMNQQDSTETNLTLQASGSAVSKAVQTVTGISPQQIRQAYRQTGDLGDIAAQFFGNLRSVKSFFVKKEVATPSPASSKVDSNHCLTIVSVYSSLKAIATVPSGTGSQKMRQKLLIKLLRSCKNPMEVRFLVRILLGNMRLGATSKTVLASLGMAVHELQTAASLELPKDQSSSEILSNAYNICPRLEQIVLALFQGGLERVLKDCSSIVLFCPVQPMLANPAHSLAEVQTWMQDQGAAIAEWKYDGVRCQAHSEGEIVKLYSRHLLDHTDQFPDVVKAFLHARSKNVQSFVCDAEVVAVAPLPSKTESRPEFRLLPFQELATRRGRKNMNQSVTRVRIYCFDLLYLNGESLLQVSLWERQKLLQDSFSETPGFAFATKREISFFDHLTISTALEDAVRDGAEGLMMKLCGQNALQPVDARGRQTEQLPPTIPTRFASYESGYRSQLWLKLKRDYVGNLAETIDVVPIGAWHGSGRKAKAGYLSPVLFAVYNEDEGVFYSISRCMSFSDAMYEAMRKFYFYGIPYPDDTCDSVCDNMTQELQDTKKEASQDDCSSVESNGGNQESVGEQENCFSSLENDKRPGLVNCFSGNPPATLYVTNERPSIWFKPMEVFEVSFADLSLSRAHTAGSDIISDPEGRGIALRFPRFKRRRPDKSIEQATTTHQIASLFFKQTKIV